MNKQKREIIKKTLVYFLLIIVSLIMAFPLVFMLSTALKSPKEIASTDLTIIPNTITYDNFYEVFYETRLVTGLLNSFKVAALTAIIASTLSLSAGYTLARIKFTGTSILQIWIVVSQTFPLILIIIPLFIILRTLGLLNQHLGLVLVYVVWAIPFSTWMLKGYVQAIPAEIEDAALIDGCSRFKMLYKILLPIIKPGIVATSLFAFILGWQEFFFALVVLRIPEKATVPVLLTRFIGLEGMARWGALAAASLVATLPALVVFLVFQKHFISGLMGGAVKQ